MFNLYGPTETNVCTAFEIPKTFGPDQNVPIGSPVPGNECLILLESGQMEDFGKGELLVAGSHVMTGYRNSSNEGCFLEWNQKRFYKTGDIVERREREEFQLIGRKDGLVKSWGYRVHPGESEKILQALPGVKDAAVIALPHSQAGFLLYAAVVQEEGGSLDVDGLISRLRQELLPAAVPGEFRILDALPLNANGKVDRVALAQLLSVKN